ncbi:hypothetical protein RSOLAG22IIIB_04968 [Rhizoctonia solani]|uniref:MYND-type domain-containing protein n=1 Tax=Rhizoctonia solani TaxID=456999 RepID=A0A0K6G2N4_9AGAM|nr:hypothetical protein RSOLAG22IIIB_04968 [Rhizoctonia solani]
MNSETNQRWGRPLEQYATSYSLAVNQRGAVSWETEEAAQFVKESMAGHVLDAHGPVPGVGDLVGANDITVPMLQTVLELAHSPHHLDFFADPVFIGGCIRFLTKIRPEGVPSPFSHELGYLCFRIIAIGIGAWILKVTGKLGTTARNMQVNRATEPLRTFSRGISRALIDIISEGEFKGSGWDWVMGWGRTREHMNPERFLLPSDLRSLLSTLWEDRKLYLRALLTTYFPGISGVMFVLWRYLDVNPAIESAKPTKLMAAPFCDLLWRSMLASLDDQWGPLAYIERFVFHGEVADLWHKSPKYFDLDDSRTLLCALNTGLSPTDLQFFAPHRLMDIRALLPFVTGSIQQGSEDLSPALVGGVVGCIWRAIEKNELDTREIVERTASAFTLLGRAITPLDRPSRTNNAAAQQLVTEIEQHDFIELLARLIVLLKPGDARSTYNRNISRNARFIANTMFLVRTLAKVAPNIPPTHQLKDDWSKMKCKLSTSEIFGPPLRRKADKELHSQVTELWDNIGQLLALGLRTLPNRCSYSRCPCGIAVIPVEFVCTWCREFRYCSAECQARDWLLDHGEGSHRQLCKPITRTLTVSSEVVVWSQAQAGRYVFE